LILIDPQNQRARSLEIIARIQKRLINVHPVIISGLQKLHEVPPPHGGSHSRCISGHADSRTTKLYDRRGQKVLLEDMERIRY